MADGSIYCNKIQGQFIKLVLKFKVCQVAMDGLIGILILREKLEPIDF